MDDGESYPDEYTVPEWLGMKRYVIPFSDGFIDD